MSPHTPEARLKTMNISLPQGSAPAANYVPSLQVGDLVYISGQIPKDTSGQLITGRLGDDLTTESGYEIARDLTLQVLAILKQEIGDLDRIKQFVKIEGMVQATPDFKDHSKVINGCSDFLMEIFGDQGKHTRTAVGMSSLPFGIPVEICAIVQIEK